MGKQDEDVFVLVLLVVLGMIMGVFIAMMVTIANNDVGELGQSICEEEYGMDYSLYNGETLYCKPAPALAIEDYDGIKVKIKSSE